MKPTMLIISCEHAVNAVPEEYQHLFDKNKSILQSSHAIDFGSLAIAQRLSHDLNCQLTQSSVTRLLVDCNRNDNHAHCFSEYSKPLSKTEKQHLLDQYYHPFRQETEHLIKTNIDSNQQVLHLSIHSFAPVLNGQVCNAGIGLLYDSHRHAEKEVARLWNSLLIHQTAYRIRMNYPASCISEGFISSLRKQYLEQDYLGLELQVNQALIENSESIDEIINALSISLKELMQLL